LSVFFHQHGNPVNLLIFYCDTTPANYKMETLGATNCKNNEIRRTY
jgi:hypothetical protein